MKTWKQRLIAALCCVVLLLTSLYVTEPQNAEAATASGTMSITTTLWGLNLKPNGGEGFINMSYTGVPTNYSTNGQNFLNKSFAEEYITFGGGMTYADLIDGMVSFYVATDRILQFNWANRTTPFTYGWSFTIAQGALLPYVSTSGTAYMALDKEYTFTFVESNNGYDCEVTIVGQNVTTFSLGKLGLWGNGSSGAGEAITIDEIDGVSNWQKTYEYIHNDANYEDYIRISDLTFDKFDGDIKLRYILDGATSCFQMEEWGSLRTSMTKGDQLIFYKGLPIYFKDSNGAAWKATLDATYVYECSGSNEGNTQIFYGVKIDDSTPEYGLNISSSEKTSLQGNEQFINVGFDYATVQAGVVQTHSCSENILTDKIAEEYLQIAGYTVAEALNMGIAIRYIPNANCIQMAFGAAAVKALKVGDTIVLKEGLPVVYLYNGTLYAAKLDAEYTFTVTANNGTNLTFTRNLSDSYSLTGTASGPNGPESGYTYFGFPIAPDEFTDAQTRGEGVLDPTVWQQYVALSNHTTADLTTDDSRIRWYTYLSSVFQGIRLYSNLSFVDGEQLIIKKGLPITYNTSVVNYSDGSGVKTKVTYLDKDYGFVYDASTGKFTYDASLTAESLAEKFKFTTTSATTFYEAEKYRMNVGYTSTKEAATTTATTNILKSTGDAGNTADYVDFCGMTSEALDALGVSIILYPSSPCFQIVWGTDALSWVEIGNTIIFKEGMPVYYATGDVMLLSETVTYTISAITETSFTMVQYAESGEYALAHTQFGTGLTSASESLINIVNAETGKSDALDDANTTYVTFDTDTISRYVDFCGLTAKELDACGTWIKAIRNGTTQVFQIHWGTVTEKMAINDQIIFYEGLPIEYTTTEGLTKKVYLNETVIFTVATGNDGNTYVLNYTAPESFGLWAIDSGAAYTVAGKETGAEGYYNNINLFSSDLTEEVSAVRYTLTTEQLDKYVDFAGLDAATYGFDAIVIIDGDTKVVQLQWGSTTSQVEEGDEIIFKAGLPIQATTTAGAVKTFTLDANCTFTIQKFAEGNNGYRIVGVQVSETNTTPGDVDEDYVLNKNDISLLKKELIGLIHVTDSKCANANADTDGTVDCADLVYALKNWNVDEKETYTTIYEGISLATIAVGDTYTVAVNQDLGDLNYLRLTFDTTENIYGTFYYSYNGSEYQEHFYLAEDEVQFEQFLDNYRTNGVWGTTKVTGRTLTKISFKNVGDAEATFLLNKIEKAERVFENSDMLYVQNNDIKIGVDLNMGGSLAYYESLKYEPVEYRDSSNRTVHIEPKADYSKESTYKDVVENVNLINIYDLGRQVQQSFYIDVQDTDYEHGSYNNDDSWPYNPVQAGDKENNMSQVVDYRKIDTDGDGVEDMIYVKTRAMDWSNPGDVTGGTTTESYMENWYKLSDNLLYVDNAFVDWAGWEDNGSQKSQELPAFYTGQALNYFVAGNDTSTRYGELGSWTGSGESYHVEGNDATSNWYAWVNADADNAFGLGIYIPNAYACTAGRCVTTNIYSLSSLSDLSGSVRNRNAKRALILDLGFDYLSADTDYQNCYLYNTSYIAPTKTTILQEYTSYEYTYVLTADRLSAMSSTFETLDESQTVTNDAMDLW